MYRPLVPCPSCKRHVRAAEAACPFCAEPLPDDIGARAIPGAPHRMTRAAAFVFGATVAVAGCGTDTDGGGAGGGGGEGGMASSSTGPADDGGVMALYGAPTDAGPPDDDGGGQAEYGASPPPDG